MLCRDWWQLWSCGQEEIVPAAVIGVDTVVRKLPDSGLGLKQRHGGWRHKALVYVQIYLSKSTGHLYGQRRDS